MLRKPCDSSGKDLSKKRLLPKLKRSDLSRKQPESKRRRISVDWSKRKLKELAD